MARWSKKRVGAGVAVGAVLAGCLVAARVIISGADRDAAHVAAVSTSSSAGSSSAEPNADGARQATSFAEVMSVDGIDIDRVAKRTGAFQGILDSLRYYAGRDMEPTVNTNRLDLASFVDGRDEAELAQLAVDISGTHPYASLQLVRHLLQTSHTPSVRVRCADNHILLMDYWDEEDKVLADEVHAMMRELYVDDTAVETLTGRQQELIFFYFQKHRLFTGRHEFDETLELSRFVRAHARTDLDHAHADWWELAAYERRLDDEASIRHTIDIVARMKERGVYADHFSESQVDRVLSRAESKLAMLLDNDGSRGEQVPVERK